MSKTGRARFIRCVALILCFAMLPVLNGCGEKTMESSMSADSVEEVITQLADQSPAYGFNNALSDLEEKSVTQIGGDSYIRLQQRYNGIPVYGKTIVCTSDENGTIKYITGNVKDVDEEIDLTPSITAEQAQQNIKTYMTEVLNLQNTERISIELCEENLYIYMDTDQPTLVYSFLIGANRVILDAHDASVLSWQSVVVPDEIWYTGPEGTKSVQGANPIDGKYILKDAKRNIYVYDAQGQIYWYPGTGNNDSTMQLDVPVMVNSVDTEFGDDDDNTNSSGIAYTFLNELGAVYDFFADFGETGVGIYVGICNDLMNDPNNPTKGYQGGNAGGYCGPLDAVLEEPLPDIDKPLSDINAAVVVMGSAYNQNMGSIYDLFGHEYQHTVFQKYAGNSNSDEESGAVNEGIADIMGELYEASRGEINWEHGRRIIHDPSQEGYPESVKDINSKLLKNLNTDFSHGCSTVISHSAYLMWNGIDGTSSRRLSTKELTELWYRAVLMMPADCDFILCRQLVEVAAQSMETLNDEQRECVREAFDRVGIPSTREDDFYPDYRLNKDATLTVYDQNNEPYSGYTLQINGTIDLSEIASNMIPDIGWVVNRTNTVEEPGAYELDLPQGCYMLTITDRYYDESYTIYVEISNDHSETNINLITAYEEPLVVVIPELDYENLVTDAYQDAFVDDDGFDYCYHIPLFNLRGNWAQQINKTIYDQCYALLKEEVYAGMDEYGYPYLEDMVYCWGYHEDFASVVIETNTTMYADTEYMVFTISTSTGKEISTDELLASYGMNREEFYAIVRNRLKQYWDERRDIRNDVGPTFFDDRVTNTLADSNIHDVLPFINPAGGLSFVANIYSLAAGDSYLHLINTEGMLQMDYLECSKDHSKDTAEPTGDVLQYFIEHCDKLYFTDEDVQTFDDEMCMYARNAIFAKSGRKFQSQSLHDYFGKYSWYVPSVEADAFSEDLLNRKQLANLAVIQAREETLEIESLMASLDGEAGIYTRYLHNGGYDELLDSEYDKNTLEVSSSLADFDNDGTKELFLSFKTGQSGIRGMENYTYLLDIESNQVGIVSSAYFGGGSMGGDHLAIKFDRDTQSHVVVMEGYTRHGVEAYIDYMEVYSKPGFKVGKEFFNTYYSLYNNWYGDYVDKVRSETTLYYEDEYDFRFYQIDGQYVTEEAFNNALARYEEPKDGYAPKVGTYANPIT